MQIFMILLVMQKHQARVSQIPFVSGACLEKLEMLWNLTAVNEI